MYHFVFWLLCAVQNPSFQDPQHRFSLSLVSGWQASASATLGGPVVFQKMLDHVPAMMGISVMPGHSMPLTAWSATLLEPIQKEPQFKLLSESFEQVAKEQAVHRVYVVGVQDRPRLTRMVHEFIFLHHEQLYLIHLETIAEFFVEIESDMQKMISSFDVSKASASPQ